MNGGVREKGRCFTHFCESFRDHSRRTICVFEDVMSPNVWAEKIHWHARIETAVLCVRRVG